MLPYTVVLGIDQKTLELFKLVWPTWMKHKPTLAYQPWVIFYNFVTPEEIMAALPNSELIRPTFVPWPPKGATYERDFIPGVDPKWTNPQRAKMLAGFVHVPANYVMTPYWLKLDADVIATGRDEWVDPVWFDGNPSIIAPGWPYTKPANQVQLLDQWVAQKQPALFIGTEPLNLVPNPKSDKLICDRICSWCAFFNTEFTRVCARAARYTCGEGQLPVDSQDGFLWYAAKRCHFTIRPVRMKRQGWTFRSSYKGVKEAAEQALGVPSCNTSNVVK